MFDVAEIAKFNREQLLQYEDSLKYYRDLKNSFDTAREDGKEKGRQEGKQERNFELAKAMLEEGIDVKTIAKITGLTEELILR